MLLFSLPPWNVTVSFRLEKWSTIISPLRLSHPKWSGGGSPPSDSSEFHILNFMDPNCWGHGVLCGRELGVRCSHPSQSFWVAMTTKCYLATLHFDQFAWVSKGAGAKQALISLLRLSPTLTRFITRLSPLSLPLLKLISFPFFPYSGPKRWMFDISFEAC